MTKFDNKFWEDFNQGWISQQEAKFLVEHTIGNSYIEIGVAFGISFRVILHHFPRMDVLGVDIIDQGIEAKVRDSGLWSDDRVIKLIVGNSRQVHEQFPDNHFSTLFIDGDHSYEGCKEDFNNWFPKVKSGGSIIFHDYGRLDDIHKGIKKAVDEVKNRLDDFESIDYIAYGMKPL